jgi:hypothetical protein
VTLDRLGHEALLADPLHEQLAGHLALPEARDLCRLRQIGGRVLDRVVHVVRRHLNRQSNVIFRQFFDLGLHRTIRAEHL